MALNSMVHRNPARPRVEPRQAQSDALSVDWVAKLSIVREKSNFFLVWAGPFHRLKQIGAQEAYYANKVSTIPSNSSAEK